MLCNAILNSRQVEPEKKYQGVHILFLRTIREMVKKGIKNRNCWLTRLSQIPNRGSQKSSTRPLKVVPIRMYKNLFEMKKKKYWWEQDIFLAVTFASTKARIKKYSNIKIEWILSRWTKTSEHLYLINVYVREGILSNYLHDTVQWPREARSHGTSSAEKGPEVPSGCCQSSLNRQHCGPSLNKEISYEMTKSLIRSWGKIQIFPR